MYVKKTYIAEDGKAFDYELECRAHEAKLFAEMYGDVLSPFVSLFNRDGNLAEIYYMNEVYYVYVKQLPNFEDEEFMDIWDKIIPGNLTAAIEDHGIGWYFRGDNNEWYSWNSQEEYVNRMKQAFDKMSKLIVPSAPETKTKLFVYSKPNTMDGYLQNGDCHRYTDDVALCYANSLEEATEIFCKLYERKLIEGNVKEASFNKYGICICTDF